MELSPCLEGDGYNVTVKDKDEKKSGCVATNLREESAPPCDITRGRLENHGTEKDRASIRGKELASHLNSRKCNAGKWSHNTAPSNQVLRLISLLAGEINASGENTSDPQPAGSPPPGCKNQLCVVS